MSTHITFENQIKICVCLFFIMFSMVYTPISQQLNVKDIRCKIILLLE